MQLTMIFGESGNFEQDTLKAILQQKKMNDKNLVEL
jgi:hypothetical protein